MIYRMFFGEDHIESLEDFANIHKYVDKIFGLRRWDMCNVLNVTDIDSKVESLGYCMFNGFLIFSDRVYCEDKHKLEELQNLYILMGGEYNWSPENMELSIDCIKLLGEI